MNQELFDTLWERRPSQHRPEFRAFLEICEMYMNKRGIEDPVIVELGIYKNKQKQFYEQLLGLRHIGIDGSGKRSTPDILGNTHSPETLNALKKKLEGRPINILFIDASHCYDDVKQDYELYSPLCTDIIAFHDIETCRHITRRKKVQVWRFWDELRAKVHKGENGYKDLLFLSIFQHKISGSMGIGMIIKR